MVVFRTNHITLLVSQVSNEKQVKRISITRLKNERGEG